MGYISFAPAQDAAAQVLQQDVRRLLVRGRHARPGLPTGPAEPPARARRAPEAPPPAPRPAGSRVPDRLRPRGHRRRRGRHFNGTRRNRGSFPHGPASSGRSGPQEQENPRRHKTKAYQVLSEARGRPGLHAQSRAAASDGSLCPQLASFPALALCFSGLPSCQRPWRRRGFWKSGDDFRNIRICPARKWCRAPRLVRSGCTGMRRSRELQTGSHTEALNLPGPSFFKNLT